MSVKISVKIIIIIALFRTQNDLVQLLIFLLIWFYSAEDADAGVGETGVPREKPTIVAKTY